MNHFMPIHSSNHPSGWFEEVYARAKGNGSAVPWANLQPSPMLIEWLEKHQRRGQAQKALVVGCGLGDDAEALARRGFEVTAFDISPTAIKWCRRRFPDSPVNYQVADLFAPPPAWEGHFDFILEYFTIQALPPHIHGTTIEAITRFIAPGGEILVICLGRDAGDRVHGPPWPLSREELHLFQQLGLAELAFERCGPSDSGAPLWFRAWYRRPD